MGKASRDKGYREENQLVKNHKLYGLKAERVPLSGGAHYQGNFGDLDVYWKGDDEEPVQCEVKARKNGEGFKTLEDWMGDHEVMFLKRNYQPPMIVMTWDMWIRMLTLLKVRDQ